MTKSIFVMRDLHMTSLCGQGLLNPDVNDITLSTEITGVSEWTGTTLEYHRYVIDITIVINCMLRNFIVTLDESDLLKHGTFEIQIKANLPV